MTEWKTGMAVLAAAWLLPGIAVCPAAGAGEPRENGSASVLLSGKAPGDRASSMRALLERELRTDGTVHRKNLRIYFDGGDPVEARLLPPGPR